MDTHIGTAYPKNSETTATNAMDAAITPKREMPRGMNTGKNNKQERCSQKPGGVIFGNHVVLLFSICYSVPR